MSFFKILLLVLAAGGAWYAYRKWIAPLPAKPAPETVKDKPKPPAMVEDMKLCPVCGAYVAPDKARHCGRGDCPYPKTNAP